MFGLSRGTEEAEVREESQGSKNPPIGGDPLEEKLRGYESGGGADGADGPGGAEDQEEHKKKAAEEERRERAAKMLSKVFAVGVGFLSKQMVAYRGDHWALSKEEFVSIAEASLPVSRKYVDKLWVPVWLDRYEEEFGLALVIGCIVAAKVEAEQKAQAGKARADGAGV